MKCPECERLASEHQDRQTELDGAVRGLDKPVSARTYQKAKQAQDDANGRLEAVRKELMAHRQTHKLEALYSTR